MKQSHAFDPEDSGGWPPKVDRVGWLLRGLVNRIRLCFGLLRSLSRRRAPGSLVKGGYPALPLQVTTLAELQLDYNHLPGTMYPSDLRILSHEAYKNKHTHRNSEAASILFRLSMHRPYLHPIPQNRHLSANCKLFSYKHPHNSNSRTGVNLFEMTSLAHDGCAQTTAPNLFKLRVSKGPGTCEETNYTRPLSCLEFGSEACCPLPQINST